MALVGASAVAAAAGVRGDMPAEGRDWLLAVVCAPLGARIATHAARNACGWLVLAVGVLAAATVAASAGGGDVGGWLREWLWWPGYGLLILVALLFPDGRPAGRRWRWVVAATVAATAASTVALAALALRAPQGAIFTATPVSPSWDTTVILAGMVALLAAAACAVATLVLRAVRATLVPRTTPPASATPPTLDSRTAPAVRATSAARGVLVAGAANGVLLLVATILDTIEDVPLAWLGAALAIPLATAIGVVRYGLYDIDLLVHRALVSGVCTLALIGLYAATVALVAGHVPAGAGPVAAAVTVVALLPLRQGVDAALRRVLYGLGSDPYALSTLLGHRVGGARTPEEVLAAAAGVIGAGLKSPYVAIQVGRTDTSEYGRRLPWPVTSIPLVHHGRLAGHLILQQRAPDEPWSRRERAVLRHLAAQLAPSAASAGLTRDLRTAREHLVRAREEELRRLQRDLHDGVGPLLFGTRMLARNARRGGPNAPDLLQRIDGNLADAAGEVRRIVDGLRPPALDRGLEPALTHAVERHRMSGLAVELCADGDLADLPAAAEVAAYRVIDEALTNVVKHAGASQARVRVLRTPGGLSLTVTDDGAGGVRETADGVGVSSMRQRCEELGGTFTVAALTPGTELTATIPIR